LRDLTDDSKQIRQAEKTEMAPWICSTRELKVKDEKLRGKRLSRRACSLLNPPLLRPYWYSVLQADNGPVLLVVEAIVFTVDDGVCVEPRETIPEPSFRVGDVRTLSARPGRL
jgi:hypothetical protein